MEKEGAKKKEGAIKEEGTKKEEGAKGTMGKKLKKDFGKYVCMNVLGMIGLSCYILADTYFVSERLGADGLTALNLAISIYSIINGLGLMLGIGGATRYAICKAAKEEERGSRIFTCAVILGAAAGAVLAVTGLLGAGKLAGLLGAEGEILELTKTYLRTLLLFSPCFILNNILNAFIRNDQDPKLAMGAMLCGSFSNILLDYVFMYPLGMGMFGAALATGIAPVIGMAVLAIHFKKGKPGFRLKKYRVCRRDAADIGSLGVSAFVNELSSSIVLITFNLLILGLAGNTGVAAYGIVANLALVAVSVCNGIAQGSQPLISGCYGAKEEKNVKKVFRWSAGTALCFGILTVLAAYAFTEPLTAVFNSGGNAALAEIAHQGLRLYMLGFLAAGINIAAAAYFSAVEQPRKSFGISILRGCVGILLFAAVLSRLWGMTGIWLAFPVTEAATLLGSILIGLLWKHYHVSANLR